MEKVAILLVGHGSETEPQTSAPVRACATEMRSRGYTVDVAFWKGDPGLEGALDRIERPLVVIPFFMANGFYVSQRVPNVLNLSDAKEVRYTEPIGVRAEIVDVVLANLSAPKRVVVAGHGTPRSPTSRDSTHQLVDAISAHGIDAVAAFVDDDPKLVDVVRADDVIVPMFVATSGHVRDDIIAQFPSNEVTAAVGEMSGIADIVEQLAREA